MSIATITSSQATSTGNAIESLKLKTTVPVAGIVERDSLFPTPAQGNSVWRSDLGWEERYFGLYSATTNPGGATPAGWYPTSGTVPFAELKRNSTAVSCTTGSYNILSTAFNAGWASDATIDATNGTITINKTGMYFVNAQLFWSSGAGATYRYLWVTKNYTTLGTPPAVNSVAESLVTPSFSYLSQNIASSLVKLTSGDVLRVMGLQNSGATLTIADNSTAQGVPAGLTVRWAGPAR
jgi:hypothetical protein